MPSIEIPNESPTQHVAARIPARRARVLYRLRKWVKSILGRVPPIVDDWKPAGGSVMVIAPHPDDEVIGCGGTLLRHAAAGDHTICVYLTRGENSRGYSWYTPEQRQAKREQEARNSSAILQIKELIFLDGKDGNLADAEVSQNLTEKMAAIVAEKKPRLIYVPHVNDNHPDHAAAYRIIESVVGEASTPLVYQYELWSPLTAEFAIDISKQMPAKIKAIKCHDLAMDAFDYVPTMVGLAAYRSGTSLQRSGYAEAFRKSK